MKMSSKVREKIEEALAALSRHDPGDCESILVDLLGYRVKANKYGDPEREEVAL